MIITTSMTMMNEKNNYKWRQELNDEDEDNDDDNDLYAIRIKKEYFLNVDSGFESGFLDIVLDSLLEMGGEANACMAKHMI